MLWTTALDDASGGDDPAAAGALVSRRDPGNNPPDGGAAMSQRNEFDLTRTLLQILTIGVLIAAAFWILQPFLVAVLWAATVVIATWPLLVGLESAFGGRRGPAVAVMTLALLLVVIVPLAYGVDALVGNTDRIVAWSHSLATMKIPPPPQWLASLPLVGEKIVLRWSEAASLPPDQLAERLAPYGQQIGLWLVHQVGGIGKLVGQFLLTVIVSAIFYVNGETVARGVLAFARRLAGSQGEEAAVLAAMAVRGVALGVVVTAALQTSLTAVGLLLAGVPFAPVLVAIVFVLCIAQLGPLLVVLPSTWWVYSVYGSVAATVFFAWGLGCGLMDNFVRPVLIRRGADLPLLLIFAGVFGGLLAMGVLGLFLGPVLLAVGYTVLASWVQDREERPPAAEPN